MTEAIENNKTTVISFRGLSEQVKNLDNAMGLLYFAQSIGEDYNNAKKEARNKILQYVRTNKDSDKVSKAFPDDAILQSMLKKRREEIKNSNPKPSIFGAVKNALSKALPF